MSKERDSYFLDRSSRKEQEALIPEEIRLAVRYEQNKIDLAANVKDYLKWVPAAEEEHAGSWL